MGELSSRAFQIDTVGYNNHQLTFVSMENNRYSTDEQICPADRFERVANVVAANDLTVVEYFTPEIEETTYCTPFIGTLAKKTIGLGPDGQYEPIAKAGHELGARMGVADIANRPLFGLHAVAGWLAETLIGVHEVKPARFEHLLPTATDARRMLTAEAIIQEANRHPRGTSIAYIGAPAHTNRIKQYVMGNQTRGYRARRATYLRLPGLDKSLRIYEPDGETWKQTGSHQITAASLGSAALHTT